MYRKGELSNYQLSVRWPYMVAVHAGLVSARFKEVLERERQLGAAPRHRTVRFRGEVDYIVFRFTAPEAAEAFRAEFLGCHLDPRDLGKGKLKRIWNPRDTYDVKRPQLPPDSATVFNRYNSA